MDDIVQKLIESGYARTQFNISQVVPDVIGGFQRFLEEDVDHLAAWELTQKKNGERVPILPWDEDPDDLLLVRRPDAQGHDHKDGWHWRQWSRALIHMHGLDPRYHEDFLRACEELHGICLDQWYDLCLELDTEFPGMEIGRRAFRSPFHCLRILQYRGKREGTQVTGKAHTDKCAMTFHLAEQHPACELDGQQINCVKDSPIVFGADKIEQLTSGAIRSMPHQVNVLPNSPTERWVIVFFAHT